MPAATTPVEFARQLNQLLDDPQRLEAMSGDAIAFARSLDADRLGDLSGIALSVAAACSGTPPRRQSDGSDTMSNEPLVEESPFKGQTGLRRVWNALHYSLAGLHAAYRNEDAFRQESWLAAFFDSNRIAAAGIGNPCCVTP